MSKPVVRISVRAGVEPTHATRPPRALQAAMASAVPGGTVNTSKSI